MYIEASERNFDSDVPLFYLNLEGLGLLHDNCRTDDPNLVELMNTCYEIKSLVRDSCKKH